jgi:Legume lectin domain
MRKISQANRSTRMFDCRRVVAMGLFCAAVLLSARPTEAQQFVYNNFSSPAGITFNGSAAPASNGTQQVLRITPASNDQVGTAWYTTPVSLVKGFSTTFRFQISGTTSFNADGFAFVIQNGQFCNGTSGATANEGPFPVGCPSGEGGSLGYISLTKSVAIEFDTFGGPPPQYGDLSNSEVGIQSCGALANTVDHTVAACNKGQTDLSTLEPTAIILTDGAVHTATISYTPATTCGEFSCNLLVVIVDGVQVLSAQFDMSTLGLDANQDAYVGFTGATGGFGGGNDNQDILSWSFDTVQTKTLGGPGTTTTFTFNTDTYKITGLDNSGGEQVTVDAFAIPASLFPAFTGFPGETCVPYGDYSTGGVDTCVEFQVHCQVSAVNTTACNFDYDVATGYDLPADLSGGIGGPDFLVAHFVDCPLTSGSPVQSIFLSYEAGVKDPTTRGGSRGPSCFVATYHPTATAITTGVGLVGWGSPVVNTALNQVKAGSTRPLIFQFFDNLGSPVTNLSFCNSFTGTACNDPGVVAPWINIASFGIACPNGAPINPSTDTTVSFSGNSGFQNNGGGNYQLNWKTQKGWNGSCANVQVTYFTGGAANVVLFPANVGFQFN